MTYLLLLAPVSPLHLFGSFWVLFFSVWLHLNSKQVVAEMKISQGHLRSPLSVSCPPPHPTGSVGGGNRVRTPPLHEQQIIYSGFLMPTVKLSRSQFDFTHGWGSGSASLVL